MTLYTGYKPSPRTESVHDGVCTQVATAVTWCCTADKIPSDTDIGSMHCHMVPVGGYKISLFIRKCRTAGVLPNVASVRRRCGSCGKCVMAHSS